MDFSNINTWLGIAVVVSIVGMLSYIILDRREKGDTLDKLIEALQAVNANTQALDLLEPLATKVVPAWLVKSGNNLATFVESLTPDQVDQLIEEVRKLGNKVTDGLPNTPQSPPPVVVNNVIGDPGGAGNG